MKKVLGIDIGDVIIDIKNNKEVFSLFSDNFLKCVPLDPSFKRISTLARKYFGTKEVYLISRAPNTSEERKILHWLKHYDFHKITGISESHVHFCRERAGKKKLCTTLGITHFIDDRLEVLSHLVGSIPYLYLLAPRQKEVEEFKSYLSEVTVVKNWNDAFEEISTSLKGQ